MSGLAMILKDKGHTVRGCDIQSEGFIYRRLKKKHIEINNYNILDINNEEIVIIGHAFYTDKLIKDLISRKITFYEYNTFLSIILEKENLVCISGSHGKTTLTKMLSHCFFSSNYLIGDGEGKYKKNKDFFFLEACEYKKHFLVYKPKEIIIVNIDYDHTDYYKNENDYINAFNMFVQKADKIYINYEDKDKISTDKMITYGFDQNADYRYINSCYKNKYFEADIYNKENFLKHIKIPFKADNIITNVIAVIAFYNEHGISLNKVIKKLKSFKMPYQRFNVIKDKRNNRIIILDYAHHPKQIKQNYDNIKKLDNNKKIIAIFKLDRRSRLESFKDDYIKALKLYDKVYLLPLSNTENNFGRTAKELLFEKATFITSYKEIEKENNVIYSVMSSKNMDDIVAFLKKK